MEKPGFWDNAQSAQKTVAELKTLKAQTQPVLELVARSEDAEILLELAA